MILIGHRGVCGLEPENTLSSVKRALSCGLTMIEVDVYCVEDRLVVIHDETVDRTTDGVGLLMDFSVEQLRKLDAGGGEKIPFLDEILKLIPGQVCLNIEIKGKAVAATLIKLLNSFPFCNVVVSSFDWAQLRQVRELDKSIPIAILTEGESPWELAEELDAIAVNPWIEKVDANFVRRAKSAGLSVYSYTVRTSEQWHKALKIGVDGVFVDDPTIFS